MTRSRRILASWAIGLVCAAAYGALLARLTWAAPSEELTFAPHGAAAKDAATVYVDLLAVDPVRESLDTRVDLATGADPDGIAYHGIVARALTLRVGDGFATEIERFPRGVPATTRTVIEGMTGSPASYPFDRYAVRLDVRATADDGRARVAVPASVTVFTGVDDWRVRVEPAATDGARERRLAIVIDRPPLLVFFACVIYCVIATIGVSAASIALLTATRSRRLESSFVTALVAMSFTIPALRAILPGAPSIGTIADAAVLLTAEVAVAVSLAAVVALWHVRRIDEE